MIHSLSSKKKVQRREIGRQIEANHCKPGLSNIILQKINKEEEAMGERR
jgi:hypothetical protein